MTLKDFFKTFDLFADAPNAVERMRDLVLELAMQGRLVSQRVDDEPASVQLERIAAQKSKLNPITKTKKKPTSPHAATDSGNTLPAGWGMTTLADLLTIWNGRAYAKDELLTEGTPVLRVGNLFTNKHWYYSNLTLEPEKYCDSGDLIFAWSASFGPFIWQGPKVIYHYHIWKFDLHSELDLDKRFLYWFLQNRTQEIKRAGHGVSMVHMTKEKMEKLPVPLPPLAEQKRIVAKVDQLMALCDQLEVQQQERETRHADLARASLSRFAQAPTPTNLNLLFHKSYTIPPADLRKSILTLAVQGKLVSQDSGDQPMQFAQSFEGMFPHEVPDSWTWARFQDVAHIASNLVKPTKYPDHIHLAPDNVEKGTGVLLPCRRVREDKLVSAKHRFFPGQIVYSKIRPNLSKVVVVDFEGLCSADMYPINALIDSHYLHRYMLSETFLSQAVKTDTRVAMPKINQSELNEIAVPVPPLAEQRRIVAKVNDLMALVDALETQLTTSRTKAAQLMEAVVAELTKQKLSLSQ